MLFAVCSLASSCNPGTRWDHIRSAHASSAWNLRDEHGGHSGMLSGCRAHKQRAATWNGAFSTAGAARAPTCRTHQALTITARGQRRPKLSCSPDLLASSFVRATCPERQCAPSTPTPSRRRWAQQAHDRFKNECTYTDEVGHKNPKNVFTASRTISVLGHCPRQDNTMPSSRRTLNRQPSLKGLGSLIRASRINR